MKTNKISIVIWKYGLTGFSVIFVPCYNLLECSTVCYSKFALCYSVWQFVSILFQCLTVYLNYYVAVFVLGYNVFPVFVWYAILQINSDIVKHIYCSLLFVWYIIECIIATSQL